MKKTLKTAERANNARKKEHKFAIPKVKKVEGLEVIGKGVEVKRGRGRVLEKKGRGDYIFPIPLTLHLT